jgi:hypothetical protein
LNERRQLQAALVFALCAFVLHAGAQEVTTYVSTSGTEQKPRSNAGVSLQGERLGMRADLAVRGKQSDSPSNALQFRPTASTEVVPSLRSALTLAPNLNLETGVSFSEWNASSATTFDTRVRYKKPLRTFFNEIDSSLSRSPEGATKQTVRLGFRETLGSPGALTSPTLTGAATFEATQAHSAPAAQSGDQYRARIEAKVAGLMPTFLGADHALGFKVERRIGVRPESTSAVTYNPSWTPGSLTQLGLNLQLQRQTVLADRLSPSVDFTWRGRF